MTPLISAAIMAVRGLQRLLLGPSFDIVFTPRIKRQDRDSASCSSYLLQLFSQELRKNHGMGQMSHWVYHERDSNKNLFIT